MLLLGLLFSNVTFAKAQHSEALNMGFINGRSTYQLIKSWSFLTRYLTGETGIPVKLVVKENYQEVALAFERGELDLVEGGAFMQSHIA